MRLIRRNAPIRLGATWDGRGTNFALFSANADKGRALPVRQRRAAARLERIALPERTDDVWHGYLQRCLAGPALWLSRARAL